MAPVKTEVASIKLHTTWLFIKATVKENELSHIKPLILLVSLSAVVQSRQDIPYRSELTNGVL
jgi:hypothetical protein